MIRTACNRGELKIEVKPIQPENGSNIFWSGGSESLLGPNFFYQKLTQPAIASCKALRVCLHGTFRREDVDFIKNIKISRKSSPRFLSRQMREKSAVPLLTSFSFSDFLKYCFRIFLFQKESEIELKFFSKVSVPANAGKMFRPSFDIMTQQKHLRYNWG